MVSSRGTLTLGAVGLLVLLLLLASGCTGQQGTPATTTTPPTAAPTPTATPIGMPNPASVACRDAGGTVEIRNDSAGNQYGMCVFPNGTACEEWALYRGEGCKPANESAANQTGAGLANPASVHCVQAGGTVEIERDAAGNEYGMCTFPNGTSCEEWALFRGEGCRPG